MIELDHLESYRILVIWQKMYDMGMELIIGRLIQYAAKFGVGDMLAYIYYAEEHGISPDVITSTVYHDLSDMYKPEMLPKTHGYDTSEI